MDNATDWDILLGLCGQMEPEEPEESEPPAEEPAAEEAERKGQRLRVRTERSKMIFDKRRYKSETNLMADIDWHWRPGDMYHVMSCGDVDFLTFLRFAIRQQPAQYLMLSSWCYGPEDVEEVASWVRRGYVERLDAYMGEIAGASYAMCQTELEAACRATGGRAGVFRNHSKVAVLLGPRFDCVVTSSANINTNPRTENTVITCDRDVALWYKDYFDGIHPFNGSPEGWEPYQVRPEKSTL